jgi:hypothetical protein
MQGESPEVVAASAERITEKLPSFEQRLAEIGQGMKDKTRHIIGGLAYRVERSRYYQGQFDGLVRDLGVEPIEGYPTYDWAVRRRLGGIYDFINTVGRRYERLQQMVGRLDRQVRTSKLLILQSELKDYSAEIDKIQEKAEKAFFFVLFPYYTSSFLLHAFGEEHMHPYVKRAILVGSLATGIVLAFQDRLLKTRLGRRVSKLITADIPKHAKNWRDKFYQEKRKAGQTIQNQRQYVQTVLLAIPAQLSKLWPITLFVKKKPSADDVSG